MRGRASKLALAAGSVVVLALAVGLVQLTRSATQAAAPPPSAPGPETVPPALAAIAEPTAARTLPTAAPVPRPVADAPRGPAARPARQPELAPAPIAFGRPELKRDANGHLVPIIPLAELRAQLPLTDAPMKACLAASGQRPTGKATLSFTVAARDGKLVVETTGVQDEETLAAYPELLECMHRTASALVLDGRPVPELGTPIYVRRHVRVDGGVLAENSIFNFSYNP